MSTILNILLKGAGVSALYATAALLVLVTADACLWEPFNGLCPEISFAAWVRLLRLLTLVLAALISFLAAHSYRPTLDAGVLTGCGAALLFGFAVWTLHSPERRPDIILAVMSCLVVGLVFGLLGSALKRKAAQP